MVRLEFKDMVIGSLVQEAQLSEVGHKGPAFENSRQILSPVLSFGVGTI